MSGRSAKEAMEKIKERATRAYDQARDVWKRGDPAEAPVGDGMVERARQSIQSRPSRLDSAIEKAGG